MSEVSIVKSRASVMMYNNEKKAWEPAEGIRGMSYVQVYHHEGNTTYRIVGRSMTDPQQVVINCSIIRNMKYNAATPTFHQWRDQRQVFGLNFHSKDDAAQFKDAIDSALEDLNSVSQRPTHTQQYVPQTPKNWQNRYVSQNNDSHAAAGDESPRSQPETNANQDYRRTSQEPEKPKTVSSSITITPSAAPTPHSVPAAPQAPATPTPPTPPAAPAAPAAPPAPPVGGGGVPAPPPPPPPPPSGGGGGGGGGSLASQIAAAKLKKAESKPEPKPSGGGSSGPFGGDMMAEMQRKLAARKAKEGGNEDSAPRNQVDPRSEPRLDRVTSVTKPVKTNHVAPPPVVNSTPSKSVTSRQDSRQNHNEAPSSGQLQELKMEILAEFRKELEAAKADIIQAMRQELSRIR